MDNRNKIIETALELFNSKGYDNVTLRMIADEIGISIGNLTYHFHKKSDLLLTVMKNKELSVSCEDSIFDIPSLDKLLREYIDCLIKYSFFFTSLRLVSDAPEYRANNTKREELLKNNIYIFFKNFKKDGIFRQDLSDESLKSLSRIIMYSHLAWINDRWKMIDNESSDINIFMKLQWDTISGYMTKKGLNELNKIYKK